MAIVRSSVARVLFCAALGQTLLLAACAPEDNGGQSDAPYDDEQAADAPHDEESAARAEPHEALTSAELIAPPQASYPVILIKYVTAAQNDSFNHNPNGRSWFDRIFGTVPSVASYVDMASGGAFKIRNAATVTYMENKANDAKAGITANMPDYEQRARRALFSVNGSLSFDRFDTNGDKKITPKELGVLIVDAFSEAGGINRPMGCMKFDGMDVCFNDQNGVGIAYAGHRSSLMNLAHELLHTIGMEDLYAFNCYGLNLTVASCTADGPINSNRMFLPDPYHRRAWGWMKNRTVRNPTVSGQTSGSVKLRPAHRTGSRPASEGVEALYLQIGTDSFVFEYRKLSINTADSFLPNQGVFAWFEKANSANDLLTVPTTELGDFPLKVDGCHLNATQNRGAVAPLPQGQSFQLRSRGRAWNTSVKVSAPDSAGLVEVSWAPATPGACSGDQPIIGDIRARFDAIDGYTWIGRPQTGEVRRFDGVGVRQDFTGGVMSWHPNTGAWPVRERILDEWKRLGGEQWGYPTTDELVVPNGSGRFNHFLAANGDERSIYWKHGAERAWNVRGHIRSLWANDGWETGRLGYPTSEEGWLTINVYGQLFEGGAILSNNGPFGTYGILYN